jgi:ribosome-associated protein
MIEISHGLSINEKEFHYDFIRASGPGGQNVNKVSTAVQLRFDIKNSSSLPSDIRERLLKISGKRLTSEGIMIIASQRFRSQEQNRKDAVNKLIEIIRKASAKPKKRKKSSPSTTSIKNRIISKKQRGSIKSLRRIKHYIED